MNRAPHSESKNKQKVKKKDNMMTQQNQTPATAAQKQLVKLTQFRGRRWGGRTSNLTGIDAELDPDTGDILKTYDPSTGELLLEFPPGAIPSTLERKIADVYFVRDRGMTFDICGGRSVRLLVAEKLVAYAIVRGLSGLAAVKLEVGNDKGRTGRTGHFVSEENALMMSFAGMAWAARQGIMPSEIDLRLPLGYFSETIYTDWTVERNNIPVADTLKWKMSEAVVLLNKHSAFIRRVGRELLEERILCSGEMEVLIRGEMKAATTRDLDRLLDSDPCPF